MGGNLFEASVRLNREEFDLVVYNIKQSIESLVYKYHILIPYTDKDSFGDVDILINVPKNTNVYEMISLLFPDCPISHNSNTISILYDGRYHIDFMYYTDNYHTAVNFYQYGDLGNILGRIANKFNCKFGFEGLYYKYNNNQYSRDILISKDMTIILKILGFNLDAINIYLNGFKTENDIFEFVCSSDFFNPRFFLLSELNHENRTRNAKRKMYNNFLQYCESLNLQGDSYYFEITKDFNLLDYLYNFNNKIYSELESIKVDEKIDKMFKERFNGKLVSILTGLQGKELGSFINEFKKTYSSNDKQFKTFILYKTKDKIISLIKNFYETFHHKFKTY